MHAVERARELQLALGYPSRLSENRLNANGLDMRRDARSEEIMNAMGMNMGQAAKGGKGPPPLIDLCDVQAEGALSMVDREPLRDVALSCEYYFWSCGGASTQS